MSFFPLPIVASTLAGTFFLASVHAQETPTGLLCNLLTQPEKSLITEPRPDFGWIVNSSKPNDLQTAYQILVASRPELLTLSSADLWNSEKITSNQSINVVYNGKPLSPQSSYWWCVQTWDKDGAPSNFSSPQQFHIGELNRPNKKWPSESRWVEVPHATNTKRWSFENRPPVDFHPQPVRTLEALQDGSWFLDFGKAAFATLQVTIDWTPTNPQTTQHTLQVAVGEKAKGNTVDSKPGGGIIYQKIPLLIHPGNHTYTLEVPRFIPHYPHSQAMPTIMPEVIPFRYCSIFPGSEKIRVTAPLQLALWVDFNEDAASFTSSNTALNQVYDLCKYSVKINTFNGDYAASQRERMMYEADSYIHQMSHYALDRSFATARYSQENMIYHASWPTEWISHSILMAWADYLHTGNSRSIARHYEELKPKSLLALAGPDSLISTRTGKQSKDFLNSIHFHNGSLRDIVDWPTGESDGYEFKDVNTVVNAFHYESLIRLAKIADALGKSADAQEFLSRAARVKSAIQEKLIDPTRGVFIDGIGSRHASLHANLFPLAFGLVPDAHRKSVIDFIKSRGMACSVYPSIYLLEALFDSNEDQTALDLMTATHDRSWLHMINAGSTVTTEAWDIKYKGNSGWTHAWSASPAQIIPRKLMGITPLEPGFGKICIQPRPASLTHAATRLPTIRGTVSAEILRPNQETFQLNFTLPANMTAQVILPTLGNTSPTLSLDQKSVTGRIVGENIVLDSLGSGSHTLIRTAR